MGINLRTPDRFKDSKFGRFFWDIDFKLNEELTKFDIERRDQRPIIGNLILGNSEFEMTYSECNRIIETLQNAMHAHNQKVKLGLIR